MSEKLSTGRCGKTNSRKTHSPIYNSNIVHKQGEERSFPSLEAEKSHDLCCAIIEQAVYDWMALKYGRLGYALARNGNSLIYRAEVESFFKGKWFEYLLSFALPNVEPTTVRRQLKIDEPERRTR